MTTVCPRCGFDLASDAPIARDGIEFDPRGDVMWQGEVVHLDPCKRHILLALLKSSPRILSRDVLAERIGYDGVDPYNTVSAHISLIRKKMTGLPLITIHGIGYRWGGP